LIAFVGSEALEEGSPVTFNGTGLVCVEFDEAGEGEEVVPNNDKSWVADNPLYAFIEDIILRLLPACEKDRQARDGCQAMMAIDEYRKILHIGQNSAGTVAPKT